MKSARSSVFLLLGLLLSPAAWANDYYVDAGNGDNSNSGTSPGDAWQTISHAFANMPGGAQTVHIAAGLYNAASGETFPIAVGDGMSLVGEDGSLATVLDGGQSAAIFRAIGVYGYSAGTTLYQGLSLRNAVVGMDFDLGWDMSYNAALSDVVISDMTNAAIRADVEAFVEDVRFDIRLDRVRIFDCGGGLHGSATKLAPGPGILAEMDVVCEDSEIVGNGFGLRGDAIGSTDFVVFIIRRSRIADNTGFGVGGTWGSMTDSVLTGNGGGWSTGGASLNACTIASNSGVGVRTYEDECSLVDCIVYGNGDDLSGGPFAVSYCDIGDGDFVGTSGNLSADPLFWAPEFGDYHLKAGSPCIDSGDPAGPLDDDGSIGDMGAYPFDPGYAPAIRNYCASAPNSTGDAAAISATGGVSLAANDFTLVAESCPAGKSGLFYYGSTRIEVPFGDGFRCVGAGAKGAYRLQPPVVTDGTGAAARLVDFAAPPAGSGPGAILAGSRWNFQFWYRDPDGGGSGYNLTDGLSAWFLP